MDTSEEGSMIGYQKSKVDSDPCLHKSEPNAIDFLVLNSLTHLKYELKKVEPFLLP